MSIKDRIEQLERRLQIEFLNTIDKVSIKGQIQALKWVEGLAPKPLVFKKPEGMTDIYKTPTEEDYDGWKVDYPLEDEVVWFPKSWRDFYEGKHIDNTTGMED
jgi:hypothetical protein